jgi:hypothetical protein
VIVGTIGYVTKVNHITNVAFITFGIVFELKTGRNAKSELHLIKSKKNVVTDLSFNKFI